MEDKINKCEFPESLTDDEKIDIVAEQILATYIGAFEELAK